MDERGELAVLADKAREPLDRADPNALLALAELIGFDGLTMEEAAVQMGFEPQVVRQAMALIPRLRELVDAYRDAKVRDIYGECVNQVSNALQGDGIPEDAARLYRVGQAMYKETRTGERERAKAEAKKTKEQKPAEAVRVDAVVVGGEQHDLDGEVLDAEFTEDTDEAAEANPDPV